MDDYCAGLEDVCDMAHLIHDSKMVCNYSPTGALYGPLARADAVSVLLSNPIQLLKSSRRGSKLMLPSSLRNISNEL